jgi:uncharacterized protein YdiU (UPF0061 family)
VKNLKLTSSYRTLPQCFYAEALPALSPSPAIICWNEELAKQLGLSFPKDAPLAEYFSGNQLLADSQPIALAYAGHQFGHFTLLGDGRAHLLGEIKNYDIQLKGSGQTHFSRRGDGKAALAPMLREYIISEAMHALNIPTTRSLAVVTTGNPVMRETLLQGAVLTRIAKSHLRVGTFEYAATQSPEAVQALVHYALKRYYPEFLESPNPARALLKQVIANQAKLVAQWMLVGFVHGVMNTDNMSIAGETIDYGPCAFINVYDPQTVFSSIDHQRRYAYGNQPNIGLWNLTRLAEALLPLIGMEAAQEALASYMPQFQQYWLEGMRRKLGLFEAQETDLALIESLLEIMYQEKLDYTLTLHQLTQPDFPLQYPAIAAWYERWQSRLQQQHKPIKSAYCLMRSANPVVIARNAHVEAALSAAAQEQNLKPFNQLLAALQQPFDENEITAPHHIPPAQDPHYQTFCGT